MLILGAMWISSAPSVVLMRRTDPNAQLPVEKDLYGRAVVVSEPLHIDLDLAHLKQAIIEQEHEEEEIELREKTAHDRGDTPDEDSDDEEPLPKETRPPSMWNHTLDFLWRHTIYLFGVWIVICIVESDRIQSDPSLNQFAILFEIISGYSGCGISIGTLTLYSMLLTLHVGYPTVTSSLSGALSNFSKFLIATCILLGRHRGLPHSVDKSVQLPGEGEEFFAQGSPAVGKAHRPLEEEDAEQSSLSESSSLSE